MTDAINAIGASSVSQINSSSSSGRLSEETKKKLEALGIDTSSIKTESEGQTKLKEAQAAQAAAQAQGQEPPKSASPLQEIKEEAKALASKVGISVDKNDKIDDILKNISAKISELQASAGTDTNKKQEIVGYQKEFDTISKEYASAKASQSMLSNSLNGLARYNKAMLSLS